jgi:hypothetical protein
MVDPSNKGNVFPAFEYTLERGKLREFLLAIEDENPGYNVDDPALPPTFPILFAFWGSGGLEVTLKKLGVDLQNVLHSEQGYEYLAPIHLGDTVTGQTTLADVYTRGSGMGSMEFLEFVTEYHNQHDEPVLKERSVIIVRGEGE